MVSLFKKLRDGLAKTRAKLTGTLTSILRVGRKIDQQLLDELFDTLITADIGLTNTEKIISDLSTAWKQGKIGNAEEIVPFLKDDLKKYWPEQDRKLAKADGGPTVILIVGINGSGKTTSIAKLTWYLTNQKKKVILAAADTFRAAAVDQLTIWADRTGAQIVKHKSGGDPSAVVFDACAAAVSRNADYLVIDTAGRLHTQENLMRELEKIFRVLNKQIPGAPHEVLLVLDATTGQNALNQARMFKQVAKVTGIFLAKLDGTAKGGIVIAIRNEVDIPVKFIGLGEKSDDIEPFDPDKFIEALFSETDE
ncbi:MAG: signal recognition particle-docking protein FtsY [Phycisphaerae bacterium]